MSIALTEEMNKRILPVSLPGSERRMEMGSRLIKFVTIIGSSAAGFCLGALTRAHWSATQGWLRQRHLLRQEEPMLVREGLLQ